MGRRGFRENWSSHQMQGNVGKRSSISSIGLESLYQFVHFFIVNGKGEYLFLTVQLLDCVII